ncbi:MAG: potassium transporter TrkG [Gemmatimonadales bacterium]
MARLQRSGGGGAEHSRPLAYAVRPRVVARHLGRLLAWLAPVGVLPLAVACGSAAWPAALAYGAAGLVMLGAGLGLARVPAPAKVQANEALAVVAAAFILTPLALVPAFMVEGLAPVDALFEAVSGLTTTGLTMLGDASWGSPSLLAARAWLQWIGGLAIVSLSIVLITRHGGVIRRLDTVAGDRADLLGGARAHGRRA